MDFYTVPIGFGMALAQNEAAMRCYAQLDEIQKKDVLERAHNVHSGQEMHSFVASLAKGSCW